MINESPSTMRIPKRLSQKQTFQNGCISTPMTNPSLTNLEKEFETLPQPIPNYLGLYKEYPSKFNWTKPPEKGVHSICFTATLLLVLQTRFQISMNKLNEELAEDMMTEA